MFVDSFGKLLIILWFNGVNIVNVNIFLKENNVNNIEYEYFVWFVMSCIWYIINYIVIKIYKKCLK